MELEEVRRDSQAESALELVVTLDDRLAVAARAQVSTAAP
jgi:hypothetical protein